MINHSNAVISASHAFVPPTPSAPSRHTWLSNTRVKLVALAVAAALSGTAISSTALAKSRTHHADTNTTSGPASTQEKAGVGAGLVVGAVAGGPVGAIIGAAFGGWLGDRFHHEKSLRLTAQEEAASSHEAVAALQQRLDGTQSALAEVETRLTAERQSHGADLEKALSAAVYFPTDKSELSPGSAEQLTRIAGLLKPMTAVTVQLAGFADRRGKEKHNEQLSAARAEAVKQVFLAAGFPEARIQISAEGEQHSVADTKDLDALALERRVDIRFDNGEVGTERVARK